jgi:hypothetical protein
MSLEEVKLVQESGKIIEELTEKLRKHQIELDNLKQIQKIQLEKIQNIGPKPISIEEYRRREKAGNSTTAQTVSCNHQSIIRKKKAGGRKRRLRRAKGEISRNQKINKAYVFDSPIGKKQQLELGEGFSLQKRLLKYQIKN